jgi:DNA-binding response OmpR family regulator
MLKVMLIEDDSTMVSLLTTLLELEGFSVEAPFVSTMDDYLKALLEICPDIALVDVNLHTGNGMDLVRQLRKDHRADSIRILMASGLNVKKECLQAGADAFIQKPYMPDELIKMIRRTILAIDL